MRRSGDGGTDARNEPSGDLDRFGPGCLGVAIGAESVFGPVLVEHVFYSCGARGGVGNVVQCPLQVRFDPWPHRDAPGDDVDRQIGVTELVGRESPQCGRQRRGVVGSRFTPSGGRAFGDHSVDQCRRRGVDEVVGATTVPRELTDVGDDAHVACTTSLGERKADLAVMVLVVRRLESAVDQVARGAESDERCADAVEARDGAELVTGRFDPSPCCVGNVVRFCHVDLGEQQPTAAPAHGTSVGPDRCVRAFRSC